MSEGPTGPARAVVLGHGSFAAGLVSAVEQITGNGSRFVALSNAGMSAADLEALLETTLSETGVAVVFTDLPAGSSTMAARRLQRRVPALVLVTGANLAVLLDFAFHEDLPPGEAARHAADKGKESVLVVGAPGAH